MNTAREKDRILAEIKACKPHGEIEGLYNMLYSLERDGMVDVLYDSERKPIRIRLTRNGEELIAKGGYAKMRTKRAKNKIGSSVARISEAVIIALLSGYFGWLLRGFTQSDNTASLQAEPIEQNSIREDSTALSTEASLLLKHDSVDNRAKSLTTISDSSANTLLIDSTGTPTRETSALHLDKVPSFPAVGYKSTPSGK